jgi:hypothetical protein
MVKRSLHQSAPRVVNATVVMNANDELVGEHTASLREQWAMLKEAAPEYLPYCTTRETYTGTVGPWARPSWAARRTGMARFDLRRRVREAACIPAARYSE